MVDKRSALKEFFAIETEARRFSGAVLVAEGGGILLEQGYGLADHASGQANTPQTLYKIGSMTKAFVVLAIMQLSEQDRLAPTHTVSHYLPDFPDGDKVTLYQLMTHTSGIWCYLQDPDSPFWPVMDQPHTVDQLLGYIRGRPFTFSPGSAYSYSNSGYVLLGAIIESVAEMSLSNYLHRHLFAPLKLENTFFDPTEKKRQEYVAVGYEHLKGTPPPISRYLHASLTYASGGVLSTVGDLYLWNRALYTDAIVSKQALNFILSPNKSNYGCGWWIDTLLVQGKSHKNIWHWGCSSGYHGMINRLVDDNVTIIMLQNFTSPDLLVPESPDALFRLRDGVAAIVLKPSPACINSLDNRIKYDK